MPLFWFDLSELLPLVAIDLEGSDVPFDLSGCCLVTMISRLFGKDDMIPLA